VKRYDAIVLGAGPAGSVTAVAFARRGARVALLEADPRSSRRFAGEWLHPAGVAILDSLGFGGFADLGFGIRRGLVVMPDDSESPIELPYQPGAHALVSEHRSFVRALRAHALSSPGVDYYEHTRAVAIEFSRRTVIARCGDQEFELSAERIVGADGQRSWLRRELGLPQDSTSPSQQAAIELLDIELPFEGFGHVVLGGPSYMLLYRLNQRSVRAVFDLPRRTGWPCTPATLWDAFGRVIPTALRRAVQSALAQGEIAWGATRRTPDRVLTRGPVMFVGDSAGVVHPLTAAGMTLGFADATACAAAGSPEEYAGARARDSQVPVLLADLLYEVSTGREPLTEALRTAVFRSLRTQQVMRERTIDLLALAETRATRFSGLFMEIAGREFLTSIAELVAQERYRSIPRPLICAYLLCRTIEDSRVSPSTNGTRGARCSSASWSMGGTPTLRPGLSLDPGR
jgi:2-polyprenyl-6-methoxyphenol hydroxylase-like FAD-dependent oxidoreductase